MEHEGEVAASKEAPGFLHGFLSRFAGTCREDAAGPSAAGAPQPTDGSRDMRLLLVRVAGEVLFHCSSNLAQVNGCDM